MGAVSDIPPSMPRWAVPEAPADPILRLNALFHADKHPRALNLGVGAYRDAKGQPHEFRAVTKARTRLAATNAHAKHQYLPISGSPRLASLSAQLIFGDSSADIATVQTISGSGALRVALEFCRRVLGCHSAIVPHPTWPNHYQMIPDSGLTLRRYRYYDPDERCVNVSALLADLSVVDHNTVVVFQPCAHNPTGADLTPDDWRRVRKIMHEKQCVVLFDMAYQGLASGDMQQDAYAVRALSRATMTLVAQSYSKNMGLYNSRVGTLSVCVEGPPGIAENVMSQLKWIIRTMYSSPPAFGARIVEQVLEDATLRADWLHELKQVVGRMNAMRLALLSELNRRGVPGDWQHVVQTRGMFVCLGLTAEQVERMRTVHHIYMTADSRINVAGLTENNVAQLADAIEQVVLDRSTLQR